MSSSFQRLYHGTDKCVLDTTKNNAVIAWGNIIFGGDSSGNAQLTNGVSAVASTLQAFAALKADGSVVAWGNPYYGGDTSVVADKLTSGVVSIAATSAAFAALKSDGSVVAWGTPILGGQIGTAHLNNVASISAAWGAFAAIRRDGSVYTWGLSGTGGNSSAVASQLTGVVSIASNDSAFAALTSTGRVVTWGGFFSGGDSSAVASSLSSGVISISSTIYAFAALKSNGSVITWGGSEHGGNSSALNFGQLTGGVVKIVGSDAAFAALKSSGAVHVWGDPAYGGNKFNVLSHLNSGVVDVIASTNAFAALKDNGSVVSWGEITTYSPITGIASITASATQFALRTVDGRALSLNGSGFTTQITTGVAAISSTYGAFAARKTDGSVITWGDSAYGGNSAAVSSKLSSKIVAVASNYYTFAALKEVYTITYKGTSSTSGAVPVDSTTYDGLTSATILGVGALARAGYSFVRWNTAANGTGTSYTVNQVITPTGNLTLYPIWQEARYTITYNGNENTGGSVPTDVSLYNIAMKATILGAGTLARTGFILAEWNTAANGSGISYPIGNQYNLSSNLTLYAIWAPRCTITYNGNGATAGAVPVDSTVYLSGEAASIMGEGSLVYPTGPFIGWNTAADGTGTTYLVGGQYTMSSDLTLYAIWGDNSTPSLANVSIVSQNGGINISFVTMNMPMTATYKFIYTSNNADILSSTPNSLAAGATMVDIDVEGVNIVSSLTNDIPLFSRLFAYNGGAVIASSSILRTTPAEIPIAPSFSTGSLVITANLLEYTVRWPRTIQGSSSISAIRVLANSELITTLPAETTSYTGTGIGGATEITIEVIDAVGYVNTVPMTASIVLSNGGPTFNSGELTLNTLGFTYTISWPSVVQGAYPISSINVYQLTNVSFPPTEQDLQSGYLTGQLVATLSETATSYTGSVLEGGIKYFSIVAVDSFGLTAVLSGGEAFTPAPPTFEEGTLVVTSSGLNYNMYWPRAVQTTNPLTAIRVYRNSELIEQLPTTATTYNGVGTLGVSNFQVSIIDEEGIDSILDASANLVAIPPSIPNRISPEGNDLGEGLNSEGFGLFDSTYRIFWNQPVKGTYPLESIKIYRNTTETASYTPTANELVATLPPTATSYTGNDCEVGTTNYVYVVVSDTDGLTHVSSGLPFIIIDLFGDTPPSFGTNPQLTFTKNKLNYVISWPAAINADPLAHSITVHRLYSNNQPASYPPNNSGQEVPLDIAATSYNGTGVEGVNYFAVRITDNLTLAARFLYGQTTLTAEDSIIDVSASPFGDNQISMTWAFNGDTPLRYSVEGSIDATEIIDFQKRWLPGDATSYIGTISSGTYYVRLVAQKTNGRYIRSPYVGPITVAPLVQNVQLSPSQTVAEMVETLATTVNTTAAVESGATLTNGLLANTTLATAATTEVAGVAGPILQIAAGAITDATELTIEEQTAKLTEVVQTLLGTGVLTDAQIAMAAAQAAAADADAKAAIVAAMTNANIGTLAPLTLDAAQTAGFVETLPNISPDFVPTTLKLQIADGTKLITAPEGTNAAIYVAMPPNTPVTVSAGTGTVSVSYNPMSGTLTVDNIPKTVGDEIDIGGIIYIIRSKGSFMFQRKGDASGGDAICFLGNAPVLTPTGYRRIDSLAAGDIVRTADGRDVAIQRVKHQRILMPSASVNPYVIQKGQFGATENLAISPRHAVSVPGRGMVEARELGLRQMSMRAAFDYYNLELPEWDNMVVAGVEVESLAPTKRVTMTAAEFRGLVGGRSVDMAKLAEIARVLSDGRVEVALTRKGRRV